jgi:HD-GYP domain-containing protein (c-di-GMP phosphodiesterase class II)
MKGLWERRSRIFVTLFLLIGASALVPLVVSGVVAIRGNREDLEAQQKIYLSRSATTIAENARNYVKGYVDQIRKIADSMRLAAALTTEDDPFLFIGRKGLIEKYREQDPAFLALRAINREGQGAVFQPSDLDESVARDLDTIARTALEGRLPVEGQVGPFVHLAKLNQSGLLLAVPVLGETGEVLGVIQAIVSLQNLTEAVANEGRRGQVAYIVDERGVLLFHSEAARALSRPSLGDIDLVAEFLRPIQKGEGSKLGGNIIRSYESSFGRRRERVIGTLAPVNSPEWGVVVEKPEREAFAVIDETVRRTVYAGVGALVLALLAAGFFARQIARPIRELAEKTREIAAGNYGQQVEVRNRNEIGELAQTFNEMSEELQRNVEDLKRAARENHELFVSSIRALAASIDAKDPYTRGHSERVCRYSILIARHMNLSREEIQKIRISALLHDVGKIGIDDRILRKPSALTDEEFEIMKQHPEKGAAIMESIPQLRDVIPGMKYHHEKFEGGGYPEGLRGEDIPMQARVIAVADTFDAMTTTRPYQKAMELSYVVGKIKSFAKIRFDPRVVEALVRAYQKGDVVLDESPAPTA